MSKKASIAKAPLRSCFLAIFLALSGCAYVLPVIGAEYKVGILKVLSWNYTSVSQSLVMELIPDENTYPHDEVPNFQFELQETVLPDSTIELSCKGRAIMPWNIGSQGFINTDFKPVVPGIYHVVDKLSGKVLVEIDTSKGHSD